MLRQVALGVFVAAAIAAPARADLHYTMHSEARQIPTADTVNPVFAMAGDMLISTMFPEGPNDSTYWVTDKGLRVELTKANALMPAGSVLLHLVDGTMLVLNPKEKTYWKIAMPAVPPTVLAGMAQMTPDISTVHTGKFDDIAGVRAEQITSTVTIQLPVGPMGAPPGMPTSITMTTDSWSSDRYAPYAALSQAMAAMFGFGALVPQGFTLKSVIRSSIVPGFEFESVVTSIREEPAPADALEIPADYKETPAPASLGMPGQLP